MSTLLDSATVVLPVTGPCVVTASPVSPGAAYRVEAPSGTPIYEGSGRYQGEWGAPFGPAVGAVRITSIRGVIDYDQNALTDGSVAYDHALSSADQSGAITGLVRPDGGVQAIAPVEVILAEPGEDVGPQVIAALARLKAIGGGVLHLPFIGGAGYVSSVRWFIDFSNCVILLDDNLRFNVTSAPVQGQLPAQLAQQGMIHFRGQFSPTPNYLTGCALIANKRVTIDCNGRNISGYTHVAGNACCGIYLNGTWNFRMENIYAYNSLAFGITCGYSPGVVLKNCEASDTVHENGITIDNNAEHYGPFSQSNPAFWSNAEIVDCAAWNCRNHGIGTWGGVGVRIVRPRVWNCGNNDNASVAGPAGGINWEFSPTGGHANETEDYHGTVIDPWVYQSWGFGFRSNCKGVKIMGGSINGTRIPTAYTDTTPPIWGSSVFVQNFATVDLHGVELDGSERYGVRIQGATGKNPACRIYESRIRNTAERAVYGIGFAEVLIAPDVVIESCGTGPAGGVSAVDLNNAPVNSGTGNAYISGIYNNNGYNVLSTSSVGFVRATNISGDGNFANATTGYHGVYINGGTTKLEARDIKLTRTPVGFQARILRTETIAEATFVRDSIQGDQSNTAAPHAEITATIMRGDIVAAVAPATAPSYVGQKYYDTAANKMYFARGRSVVGDWVILN